MKKNLASYSAMEEGGIRTECGRECGRVENNIGRERDTFMLCTSTKHSCKNLQYVPCKRFQD